MCTATAADKATALNLFRALVGSLQYSFSYLFAKSLTGKDLKTVVAQEGAKSFFDVAQSTIFRFALSIIVLLYRNIFEVTFFVYISFFRGTQRYEEAYGALSAVGVFAAEEALLGSDCSCVCLAAGLGHSEEGIFYPVGGPGRLQANLVRVIVNAGGAVYSDVPVSAIETQRADDDSAARAVGVAVACGKEEPTVVLGTRSVISGVGALCTYLRLLPEDELSEDTRAALSKLSESRPKLHVVYWLDGTAEELGLSDADYIETLEDLTDESSSASRKEFSRAYVRIWSPSMKDSSWKER